MQSRIFLIAALVLLGCSEQPDQIRSLDDADPSASDAAEAPDDARAQVGATGMPFSTYEAEAASTTGNKIVMTALPTGTSSSPELEASGRGFVRLDASGEFVELAGVRAGNRLIVRHSVPDAPAGNGATATLDVYVNGALRQSLTLSSRYNWLYGVAGENGQSNNPAAGTPHVFWDDTRYAIGGAAWSDGATIRLVKQGGTGRIDIDLIDVELAPGALAPPAAGTFLDVTAAPYGAVADDAASDSAAIQRAIDDAAAANPKKTVWIPSGVFRISTMLDVKGVTMRGRGHWHTRMIVEGGVRGIQISNSGPRVADLALVSETGTNRDETTYGVIGAFGVASWTIENLWIQHTRSGLWISNGNNGVIRNTRVYNTYADGLNLNRGSSNNLVEGNYVRGGGDDGIAVISERQNGDVVNPIATSNTVRNNTSVAVWWGSNIALRGGGGHVFENNDIADSTQNPCLSINLDTSFAMYAITSTTFRGNRFVRCGGNAHGQKRGAIWISASDRPIDGLAFFDTTLTAPTFRAVHFYPGAQHVSATFTRTTITNPGEDAVFVNPGATPVGSASFQTGSITGLRAGFVKFNYSQASTPNFTLTTSGI